MVDVRWFRTAGLDEDRVWVDMSGPVSTIALGYVFLAEPVSGIQLAGTALVLAGVFVLSRKPVASKNKEFHR